MPDLHEYHLHKPPHIEDEGGKKRTPKIGAFYYYLGNIIAPSHYQKQVDPVTRIVTPDVKLRNPGEHRDLWDEYMTKNHPEIITDYEDNHKLLPRGRVGFYNNKGMLRFLITLDKCIKDMETEIINIYCLDGYDTVFSYGTLNYLCRDCLNQESGSGS